MIQLLLLALRPRLDTQHRNALIATLRQMTAALSIPALELGSFSGSPQAGEGELRVESEMALWPCSTEELQRRVEDMLSAEQESCYRDLTSRNLEGHP